MNRNTNWKWMGGAGAVLLGVALAGCAGKNNAADNPVVATTSTATNTAAPMDDNMASAGGYENAAKTWGQIEMAKANLDQVVMDKKLKNVHEAAFEIRDLVKTLPAQSEALPEDKRKTLDSHVTEVEQLAGMLDEAGDANNEKSTHEHHMAMNDALDMMKGLYPKEVMVSAMARMKEMKGMHMGGMKGGGMGGMSHDKMGGPGGSMSGNKPSGGMGSMMDDKMPMGGGSSGSMPGNKPPAKSGSGMPAAKPGSGSMPRGGMGDM